MRVMVLCMLTLAALATGFLFCPVFRHKTTAVLFGKQAQARETVHVDQLAAQAAGLVKDGAATALRCVREEAAQISQTVNTQILQGPVQPALTAKVAPAPAVAPPGDAPPPSAARPAVETLPVVETLPAAEPAAKVVPAAAANPSANAEPVDGPAASTMAAPQAS